MLARAQLTFDASGRCEVEVIAEQPSFKVGPFVRSNGWVEIGEDEHDLDVGALVPIHLD